ncbi:MAG: hypothetical protein IJU20_02145 [Clostridia bacterium]|nr:hypothetical protein [Clostridia bacterium]
MKKLMQSKKMLISSIVSLCLSIFMLGTVSIAWFTMNREVGTSGMSMAISGMPFEIEVRGQYIENESDFGLVNDYISGTYGSDAVYENGEQPDENYQYFRATALKDKIIWRKETQDEAHGHYTDGLEPNSCGELKFWVVAKQAGFHDSTFVFDIKGYHAVTHIETQNGVSVEIVDDVYEINDSLGNYVTEDPTLTSSMVQKKKEALSYIQGHILFFRNKDENGYYSGFLGTDRSFKLSDVYTEENGTYFTLGEKKLVTVYWKWANTFEQMIYDSSYSSYSPILRNASSADRTALYSYMQPSNNSMFFGLTNSEITSDLSIVQTNGEGFLAAVTQLSNAYNDADQEIGDKVDYIIIEMTTDN